MHEFGLGRAANLAIAALPGFELPGDTSGSDKYWKQDIIDPPIVVTDGLATVPTRPGLGVNLVESRLSEGRSQFAALVAGGASH
jgi:O-succinylbenzoate synthase